MKLLIKAGTIVDGTSRSEYISDILVEDGRIVQIGQELNVASEQVLDASGLICMYIYGIRGLRTRRI